jgi:hypothetical protein
MDRVYFTNTSTGTLNYISIANDTVIDTGYDAKATNYRNLVYDDSTYTLWFVDSNDVVTGLYTPQNRIVRRFSSQGNTFTALAIDTLRTRLWASTADGEFIVYDALVEPQPTLSNTPTGTVTPTPTSTLTPTPSVTPGGTELLVYLDSGNPSSYPGTGSTWTDLEGGDDNATLFNSPTFSSSYQGILQFDDTSLEYATIPDLGNLSKWTVEAWFRLNSPLTGKVTAIVTNEFDLVDKLNFSIGTNNAPTNRNISVGFFDGSFRTTTGVVPQVGVWYQVVGTYDGSVVRQYVNGVASGGTVNYVGTPESGGEVRLMRRWDLTEIASNFVDGDLAIVKIYNGAISDSEVLSSYNSTYTRFLDITPTPTVTNTPTVTPTNSTTPTPTPSLPAPTSGFTATIQEVGSDVVWSGSGTFNLTDLTFTTTSNITAGYNASQAAWAVGSTVAPGDSIDNYDGVTVFPTSFGSGGAGPTSNSGATFGIVPGGIGRTLLVPAGYVSGTFLSGSTTYASQTIASMGLTSGTYVYSWGSGANADSLTLTIGN